MSLRVTCPCCGYLTLTEPSAYEICELCNWEDDGQNDATAEDVHGGPNSDYSLSEARRNFKTFRVMYAPGRDQRITPGDSPLEFATKGLLMEAFERLRIAPSEEVQSVEADIARLEEVLFSETDRQVAEYEMRTRRDA